MSSTTKTGKTKSRKGKLFPKILLLMSSLILSLIVGEVLARLRLAAWPFHPEPKEIPYLTERDVHLRWRYSPKSGRNSLGLKNREILPKDKTTFRVLFLGDSLVWSGETSSEELYTEVVERNLNEKLDIDKRIEVINAGIPGYTTYQESEFLKVYGFDMEPDLVVLGFVFNDVQYKYVHRPTNDAMLAREPEARLHRFDVTVFPGRLFSRSYLAHEVAYAFQKIAYKFNWSPYYTFEHRDDFYLAWKPYGWANTDALIGTMRLQLSEKNIPMVVLTFPISEQFNETYLNRDRAYVLYPQKRIKEIARQHAIDHIDLTDVLGQGGGRELFSDYLHLKPEGNDIVASVLTQYLSEKLPVFMNR